MSAAAAPPTEPSSLDGPTTAAPTTSPEATTSAPPIPKVHPLARKLAGLLSDMSLQDQWYASKMNERIIYGALAISYPIAYAMGNVLISVATVVAAGAVCLVLFLPNWRQRKDPGLKWADDTTVFYYYKQLEAARLAAKAGPPKEKTD